MWLLDEELQLPYTKAMFSVSGSFPERDWNGSDASMMDFLRIRNSYRYTHHESFRVTRLARNLVLS